MGEKDVEKRRLSTVRPELLTEVTGAIDPSCGGNPAGFSFGISVTPSFPSHRASSKIQREGPPGRNERLSAIWGDPNYRETITIDSCPRRRLRARSLAAHLLFY